MTKTYALLGTEAWAQQRIGAKVTEALARSPRPQIGRSVSGTITLTWPDGDTVRYVHMTRTNRVGPELAPVTPIIQTGWTPRAGVTLGQLLDAITAVNQEVSA